MKTHNLIILIGIISLLGCSNNQTDKTGDDETVSEILSVEQVMEMPGKYVESQITIEGMVTHVCRHGGKRLHISTPGSDVKLRVRTGKTISPFERKLEGSAVQIKGKLTEERFDLGYVEKLNQGQDTKGHHESSEHDNNTSSSEGGVSQAYINELEQKIKNSEKGYISEYWLTAEEVIQK